MASGNYPSTHAMSLNPRDKKSVRAFRTISEVANDLEVPQHVLRFWETKFSYIKPMKRGGGRRNYRPEDVALLRRIRDLLYSDGYTIKGVQRLLRENGGRNMLRGRPIIVETEAEQIIKHSKESEEVENKKENILNLSKDEYTELRLILNELSELKKLLSDQKIK